MRECERQWLVDEIVVNWRIVVENDGTEIGWFFENGDWFVAISVTF